MFFVLPRNRLPFSFSTIKRRSVLGKSDKRINGYNNVIIPSTRLQPGCVVKSWHPRGLEVTTFMLFSSLMPWKETSTPSSSVHHAFSPGSHILTTVIYAFNWRHWNKVDWEKWVTSWCLWIKLKRGSCFSGFLMSWTAEAVRDHVLRRVWCLQFHMIICLLTSLKQR